jgi:hypothetical protein
MSPHKVFKYRETDQLLQAAHRFLCFKLYFGVVRAVFLYSIDVFFCECVSSWGLVLLVSLTCEISCSCVRLFRCMPVLLILSDIQS